MEAGFVDSGLVFTDRTVVLAVGDFDGDGDQDFARGRYLSSADQILLNVPEVEIAAAMTTVAEDNSIDVELTRDLLTGSPNVTFSISGDAVFGTDYTLTGADTFDGSTGTVSIPVNQATSILTIAAVEDNTAEPAESIVVTLSAPVGFDHVIGANDSVTLSIDASVPVELYEFSVD